MKLFVHYIVNYLIELNMIDMDDAEIYYFGIAEGLLLIFNIILTLLISVILSDIKTGILFLFFFAPIRCYAGGYHAKTRKKCLFWSIAILVIALGGIKLLDSFGSELLILLYFISYKIGSESPVENGNKPLNMNERIIYKKKTIHILCLEDILALLFWRISPLITYVVVIAQIIEIILLIHGKRQLSNATDQEFS